MNTNRTTRLAGAVAAVLVTLAIHGAMLWKFDAVAQQGSMASSSQARSVATLSPVNVVAVRRS